MESRAWPKARSVLGTAQTLHDLFDVDRHLLERAAAAVRDDLSEHGVTEAYARALRDGRAIPEGPVSLLESRRAFTFALPSVIGLMQLRSTMDPWAENDFRSMNHVYQDLDAAIEAYCDLGEKAPDPEDAGEPSLDSSAATDDSAADSDEEQDYFSGAPFGDRLMSPPVLRAHDLASPLAVCKLAGRSHSLLSWMSVAADEAAGAYGAVELLSNSGSSLGDDYRLSEVAEAWRLSSVADAWRRVEDMTFVEDPPPTWELGDTAVAALMASKRYREALRVLDWMDPEEYEEEVASALPDIPDEYEDSWGTLEDWNSTVNEWNAKYEGQMTERLLWAGVEKATAHRELGEFAEALSAIPSDERYGWSPANAETRVRWARTLSYLEGLRDGAAQSGVVRPTTAKDKELDEKLQFLGKLMMEDRARGVRMERLLEAQGDLLLDIPAATAEQLREDFVADRLFATHMDGLRRGWTETAKLEEHERRLAAMKDALGTTAWALLQPDSQAELLAYRTIKETWGREHLSQAAYGLCRAFERELRSALERAGNYSRDELGGMSWGQLLGASASRPNDERLKRVATRTDELGLKAIRDAAMHPSEWAFTSEKLGRLEDALLRDGLEKKGLLRHVVTYGRREGVKE